MAQTEHLPIYKASYDLCLYLEQVVAKFARTHRYGLGTELREAVEDLKVLCRLGHDVKAFASFNAFEHAITQVLVSQRRPIDFATPTAL